MKHTISPETVHDTASLAKLRLTDDEAARMGRDLAALLELADGLSFVSDAPVQDVPAGAQPLRGDVACAGLARDALLKNAPAVADGMISVPGALREDA